jgi:hypothetical protein
MSKHYLSNKEVKKSFALKGVWLLIVLAIIFAIVLVRFAMSGTKPDLQNGLPGSDAAYLIAKEFIKPTLKSKPVSFPETGYQCAEKPDSVYIIKSYAESKNQTGEKNVTTFQITIRYMGGVPANKSSWTMLNLTEN